LYAGVSDQFTRAADKCEIAKLDHDSMKPGGSKQNGPAGCPARPSVQLL